MNSFWPFIKLTLYLIPAILLFFGYLKTNLKKELRSHQLLMPLVALIYTIAAIIMTENLIIWSQRLTELIAQLVSKLGSKLSILKFGPAESAGKILEAFSKSITESIKNEVMTVIAPMLNFILLFAYMAVKRITLTISKAAFAKDNALFNLVTPNFYEYDDANDVWYQKPNTVQARKYLKAIFVAAVIISVLFMYISMAMYKRETIKTLFFATLGFLIIGELYFYIDGLTKKEAKNEVSGEKDGASSIYNFIAMRQVLRKLFGDKLSSDDTTIHNNVVSISSADDLLNEYEKSLNRTTETYGKYLKKYRKQGHSLDANYMASGLELLNGKSILFNNPFYYDLIPYAFYAMNHKLLSHRKVLIVLGRHGIDDDIIKWCEDGLRAVTNVKGLWKIGKIEEKETEYDIGIISRSDVQNLNLHRANSAFFSDTEYIVVIEPSKLITTAQIGLNSLIRYCNQGEEKKLTFCITDKNCDGLVDALSHALMVSLSEVSATEAHEGVCSYMNWEADKEYLQHRMMPNIARYVGIGTELSFSAIKNQILNTAWYGGDAFPVVDMHWIAKQYYSDLMRYADLPVSQPLFDEVFSASANLWNSKKNKKAYITVEDEANNVFEIKREFSTRATEQSFINVISTPYMLYDYMNHNKEIFNVDSKAIPYISADYVSTKRNVFLRLAVQMASSYIWERDIKRELALINITTDDILGTLWKELCKSCNAIENADDSVLTIGAMKFENNVVRLRKKYNVYTGRNENAYEIVDDKFIKEAIRDLSNAAYVAEDDRSDSFIGSELKGQVFQKYLPGQLLTIGGKYYEMVSNTIDDRIILRRAADHITGRPVYRQERAYTINAVNTDDTIGSNKDINGIKIIRKFADIVVNTNGYWKMDAYNDFANAKHVIMNNIPPRQYNNKWMLCIEFDQLGDVVSEKILYTLANLMNETFRSLFAENENYIIATVACDPGVPLTYGLNGNDDCISNKAIYIIEDSQYDMGLLTAVERNFDRILNIVCDYLEWNNDTVEASIKGLDKIAPDYRVYEDVGDTFEIQQEEVHGFKKVIKGLLGKIKPKDKDRELPNPHKAKTAAKPSKEAEKVVESKEVEETEQTREAAELNETGDSEAAEQLIETEGATEPAEVKEMEQIEETVEPDESEVTEQLIEAEGATESVEVKETEQAKEPPLNDLMDSEDDGKENQYV